MEITILRRKRSKRRKRKEKGTDQKSGLIKEDKHRS